MKKVDIYIYKDKIKKLHKTAANFENDLKDLTEFQKLKFSSQPQDQVWPVLQKFFADNPNVADMLGEIDEVMQRVKDNEY